MALKLFSALLMLVGFHSQASGQSGEAVRVGHFSNVTHAPAVIAHTLSDQSKGWFEARVGAPIEWYVYNAGPSAMEALLAGSIDLAYVGPSPALNAYVKSKGAALKVISGVARGGSSLVVQAKSGIDSADKLRGKRIATPQFGNTQDVAARFWLISHGLNITQIGGDAFVIPTANPDQLALFSRGEIDAAWTVEPWVSRLEEEAGGKILVDEPSVLTTILVARSDYLSAQHERTTKFAKAHQELNAWISEHPSEAKILLNQGLKSETSREMPAALLEKSWKRLTFTTKISPSDFTEFVVRAQRVGFLKDAGTLDGMIEEQTKP